MNTFWLVTIWRKKVIYSYFTRHNECVVPSKVVSFKEELNIYVCKQQIKCMIKSTLIYKENSISEFEKQSGHNMSDIFKMS